MEKCRKFVPIADCVDFAHIQSRFECFFLHLNFEMKRENERETEKIREKQRDNRIYIKKNLIFLLTFSEKSCIIIPVAA